MLNIKDLTIEVNDKTVLEDFNLNVEENKVYALMGKNGSGKSSLCKSILNHKDYKKISGKILFQGKAISLI